MANSKRMQRGVMAAGLGLALAGREVLARLREADLHGQVAVVTGASRGLGFLIARELAREGCRLAICARDEAELERARQDLAGRGAEVLPVPCDVSDRAQVERFISAVMERYGRVDLLVNNAGIIQAGPLEAMTLTDFEDAMGVMYWGVVYPTLCVLPQMRARGSGRIVNITSIGGKVSPPHLVPYNGAKFAAVGFSEGLRAELARDGVSVTTVVPGMMRTGSALNAFFKGEGEKEFGWFAPFASLPFISIDAERAARQIVKAAKRGEGEIILTLPAALGVRFHGLFPGLTADLFGLANRVLPTAEGPTPAERGMEVHQRVRSPIFDSLIAWTLSAARRFNQHPGATELPAYGQHARQTTDRLSGQSQAGSRQSPL